MDEHARGLLRRAAASGSYDDVIRALASIERQADLRQRASAARTALREAYFNDVRGLATHAATPYKSASLRFVFDSGPREEPIDSGSRYALGLPVRWFELPPQLRELDQAIADSGRLSSALAMHDVVAFSLHGRSESIESSLLDRVAEVGLLGDVSAEAIRLVRLPHLPTIGARVRLRRTVEVGHELGDDLGGLEAEPQIVPRGATGTLVDIAIGPPEDTTPQVSVWLDNVDFSEGHDYEITLFGERAIAALEEV